MLRENSEKPWELFLCSCFFFVKSEWIFPFKIKSLLMNSYDYVRGKLTSVGVDFLSWIVEPLWMVFVSEQLLETTEDVKRKANICYTVTVRNAENQNGNWKCLMVTLLGFFSPSKNQFLAFHWIYFWLQFIWIPTIDIKK